MNLMHDLIEDIKRGCVYRRTKDGRRYFRLDKHGLVWRHHRRTVVCDFYLDPEYNWHNLLGTEWWLHSRTVWCGPLVVEWFTKEWYEKVMG